MARLGNICKFQSGGTPSKNNPLYFDGTIPWITTVALNGNIIDENNAVDWITEKALAESAAKIVPANSIMVGTRVGIGKVAINRGPMSTSQDIISLLEIDETKWNKAFLCKWLLAQSDYLQSQARGATIKGIKIETLSNLEIPEIPIERQLLITTCLDRVFKLISLRKQQLAKLDELVKARFVEMFGECKRRDFIGNVTAISRGASPRPISEFVTDDPDGVNWIKIGDVSEKALYIEHTDEKITLEGANKSRYVHKGDFILSNSMSFGRPYILNIDGCVHDGWLIISDYSSTFQPLYLYYAIRDDEVQNQFSGKVNGATVKNLNSDLVKGTLIKIPIMELQHQFSEYALKVEGIKLTIQQSLDKLEVLKKTLMQKYFL